MGSSPLARGTRAGRLDLVGQGGLIPARAGNTLRRAVSCTLHRAHPRSRGEHERWDLKNLAVQGSSPLARGTPGRRDFRGVQRGLIPARAGNTGYLNFWLTVLRAHPRSRGEHTVTPHAFNDSGGSSPLARGTRSEGRSAGVVSGLIPARAGNTYRRFTASAFCRAHPRSRGEHPLPGNPSTPDAGSSPLARGTSAIRFPVFIMCRLIPARAGNIKPTRRGWVWCSAHPRSRGEHAKSTRRRKPAHGSSPLARGTCLYLRVYFCLYRLIPARAGNMR